VAVTVESHARPALADVGRTWLARPPEWLWAGVVAVQVAFAALLTSYTFFFFDDFLFLQQARTQAFGWGYLSGGMFEHFSPVARLLNKIVVVVGSSGFGFAHALQLTLYACAVVAMTFVVRTILGRTWTALGLVVLFGQSVFLMRLLNWWTATGNLLPATVFVLLAIGSYVRWWDGGGRWWLIGSIGAFVGGLLDYETAILFPLFLALIRLLILNDSLDPRDWVRVLWRERWAWATYIALDVAALVNFYTKYYIQMPRPTFGQLIHFLEVALVQTFIPAMLGVKHDPTPGTAAVVASVLVFCALVAATLYLRPRAWRSLVAAVIAFVVTLVPVGISRIHLWGVYDGAELYYQQAAQFMFIVFAAFALSRRWGGHRERPHWFPEVRVLVPIVAVAAAAYGFLYVSSVHAMADASWDPHTSRTYFRELSRSIARVELAAGQRPKLIDTTVPASLMATAYSPFNRYSHFFPIVESGLRYSDGSTTGYAVTLTGELERVHLRPVIGSRMRSATVTTLEDTQPRRASRQGSGICVPPGPTQRLHIPLSAARSFTVAAGALPYAVQVGYRLAERARIVVTTAQTPMPPVPVDFDLHAWGPGAGTGVALIETASKGNEIALDMPGGACVTKLTVGAFAPVGG
jgi:hypothetical protein